VGPAISGRPWPPSSPDTLVDRKSRDEAAEWVERASANGPVSYVQADVTDRAAIDAALASLPRVDVAIGNQAIGYGIPFLDLTEDEWRRHMDINLTGCFHVGQSAARLMVERGQPGRIIFTGSWVMEVPWPEICAYSVSKAGVRMLARSMARELATHKILVNVIAPGIVYAGLAKKQLETEPQYARRVKGIIPLGDLQQAEDIARATVFLCSEGASQMTGSVLLIDGGLSLFQFGE
jgi:NAD(P)-dependent dehydrogenase (short-subunit alcohol dehydrogenase family)